MTAAAATAALEARLAAKYEGGEVTKGATVEVYKGRKVPVGTVGKVFWLGAGRYGWRVGLNDETGTTHWTALDNVKVVVGDKDPGETWADYDARKVAEAAAREARRVDQWDEVVVLAEPEFVGKVFWKRDNRLGVARLGARRVRNGNGQLRNKPEDVRWVNEDEVCKRDLYVAPEPEPEPEANMADDETWGDDFEECPF